MRADFDQGGLEPGYAYVILSRENDENILFEESDNIAMGRYLPGDNCQYLATEGNRHWSGAPQPLLLETKPVLLSADQVRFELQPAYVDSMEDGPWQVCLLASDSSPKASALMPAYDISWTGLEGSRALKDYRQEEALAAAATKDAARAKEAAALEELAKTECLTLEEAPQKPNKSKGVAVLALVLLLAIGAAGYFLFGADPEQDAAPAQQNAEQGNTPQHTADTAAAPARTAEESTAPAATAGTSGAKSVREQVMEFFAGERSPEGAIALANSLKASSTEEEDALFRLYYYAAQAGQPEAALRYAECLDPSKPVWGTIQKDGAEAWYYYGQNPAGEQAKAALKQWTEQAAAGGNAAAVKWLGEMQ